MKQILKMFLLVVVCACIAVVQGQGPYHHEQHSDFGYAIRNHRSHHYRQDPGNNFGGLAGSYGFADGRRNIEQTSYGVSDILLDPVIGYGNGGYGQGYGGYGSYGVRNEGYGYGNA